MKSETNPIPDGDAVGFRVSPGVTLALVVLLLLTCPVLAAEVEPPTPAERLSCLAVLDHVRAMHTKPTLSPDALALGEVKPKTVTREHGVLIYTSELSADGVEGFFTCGVAQAESIDVPFFVKVCIGGKAASRFNRFRLFNAESGQACAKFDDAEILSGIIAKATN